MKTIKKVAVEPLFFVDSIPPLEDMEQGKIYISQEYHGASHLCLCGCGLEVYMPINHNNINYGWDLLVDNKGEKITFHPSIGNFQFPCKSHYIITKNIANFV